MKNRIKELRKSLGLTQQAFADRIGVKRNTIGQYEIGRNEPSNPIIHSICKEFHVSEEWLRYGTGEIFTETDSFSLDKFAEQHGATDLELRILKMYFELDPEVRSILVEHFKKVFITAVEKKRTMDQYDSAPKTPEELEKLYPPINEYKNDSKTG